MNPAEYLVRISFEQFHEQCRQLAIRDRHHELLELLEQARQEMILENQDLCFWYALCLLSTVRYDDGKRAVDEFLKRHATKDDPLAMGRSHLLRSHLCIMDGDTKASYQHELKVVSYLPDDAHHELLRSWSTIDTMAGHIGDTERMQQAIEALAEVRNHLPFDQSWWYSFVIPNRADILAKRGYLEKAEALLLTHLSSVPASEAAVFRLRLAVLALEKQDAYQASEWLKNTPGDGPTTYWTTEAQIIASQIRYLQGDKEGAIKVLQEGMAARAKHHIRIEFYRMQIQLCSLLIQEGEIELASSLVNLASKSLDPWPRTFGHPIPDLIQSELEMAMGQWDQAITLLDSLRNEGVRRDHTGLLVGIYAHLAYAHAARGERETAGGFVKLATNAASNGEFAKSLTVMGTDVRNLQVFVPGVPLQFPDQMGIHQADALLSRREIEVLQLADSNLSNSEIADTLFLSLSTVKNHLSSIYSRLGVKKRRDAVATARSLGLLPESTVTASADD